MCVTSSLNPAVDVGQVEGALVMGQGYMMLEKEAFDPDTGMMLTTGTWVRGDPEIKLEFWSFFFFKLKKKIIGRKL